MAHFDPRYEAAHDAIIARLKSGEMKGGLDQLADMYPSLPPAPQLPAIVSARPVKLETRPAVKSKTQQLSFGWEAA